MRFPNIILPSHFIDLLFYFVITVFKCETSYLILLELMFFRCIIFTIFFIILQYNYLVIHFLILKFNTLTIFSSTKINFVHLDCINDF
jgi:hypothetical protein